LSHFWSCKIMSFFNTLQLIWKNIFKKI